MTMNFFGADQYSISFIGHGSRAADHTKNETETSNDEPRGKQWTKGIRGGSCAWAEGTSFRAEELETRSEEGGQGRTPFAHDRMQKTAPRRERQQLESLLKTTK